MISTLHVSLLMVQFRKKCVLLNIKCRLVYEMLWVGTFNLLKYSLIRVAILMSQAYLLWQAYLNNKCSFGILRSVEWQFLTDVSGQPVGPIFKGQAVQEEFLHYSWTAWPLKIGPISCAETSVPNYHSTLRKIPEERRSHLPEITEQILYYWYYYRHYWWWWW